MIYSVVSIFLAASVLSHFVVYSQHVDYAWVQSMLVV